jgi:type II secretion system protein D
MMEVDRTRKHEKVRRLGEGRTSRCASLAYATGFQVAELRTLAMAVCLTLLVCLWFCQAASAQEATPPGFQAYRLENTDAGKAAAKLKDLTAATDPTVEILLDRQFNRVLVKGSPETQRLAGELITALDRPATDAAAAKIQETPVLRGYRVPAEQLESLIKQLQRKHPEAARIASDLRTNQILVLAPLSLHREIAKDLPVQPDDPSAVAPAAPLGEDAAASPAPEGRPYRLEHKSWREMEDLLRLTWGARLNESLQRNGELTVFRLTTSSGAEAAIAIDRRNETAWVSGPTHLTAAAFQVLKALDVPAGAGESQTQIIPVGFSKPEVMRRAAHVLQSASQQARQATEAVLPVAPLRQRAPWGGDLLTMIFQQGQDENAQPEANGQVNQPAANQPGANQAEANQPPANQPAAVAQPGAEQPAEQPPPQDGQEGAAAIQIPGAEGAEGGFIGPVQIEYVEAFDAFIIRGDPRDVERVRRIIEDLISKARETAPTVEVYHLEYVNSETLATLLNTIYTAVFAPRQGTVNITALVQPNAILLIGRPENVASVVDLIKQLDQPIGPESEFEFFMLKNATAAEVELLLKNFYNDQTSLPTVAGGQQAGQAQLRPGLGSRLRIVSDYRSNSLVVLASRREMDEIRRLIAQIDVAKIPSTNEIRVFRLRNSLAEQLAPVLQEALTGQPAGQLGQAAQAAQAATGQTGRLGQIRSRMLQMITIDQQGNRIIDSGVLTDVKVVADARANTLLITAPAESMGLITALVRELDELPAAEAQVKVFTIINGDATNLSEMLQQLFGQQQAQQAGQLALQTAAGAGESTLIPLRFAVDTRTNSIIATGSTGDLAVVEAILIRLDEGDIQQRQTRVFRLRYAFAQAVADSINQLLQSERQILLQQQGVLSPFEQIQREVVVVPELVTNSLIVSATPRFYNEVVKIVEELDRRPPMVVIQVVIAEILLSNVDEFGAEFGLQDSLLFSRSGVTAGTMGSSGTLNPGYNFNNAPLGNSGDPASLATRENLAGQALTTFALGRTGSTGYGGLVLSAANESVNILIRALQEDNRARILSRPQIMTLDNLGAFIQRGSQVPFTGGTTVGTGGQVVVDTQFANVGLILLVTPRVTPDGLIVMEVDAENSSISDFIPVGNGGVAPQIDLSRAQTTVSARNGQTVILGGIIATSKIFESRRIPYLSDVPFLGQMFRFDNQTEERRELMIILTPWVVNNEYDMERIKQAEFARMNWCLADVVAIHGDIGGNAGTVMSDSAIIFPDQSPTAAEMLPVPDPLLSPPPGGEMGLPPPGPVPLPPGAVPGDFPPDAPPAPPDLPLAPPAPMSGPTAPGSLRESSRRMDNAYYPPPQFPPQQFGPPANTNFPVAPAAYHPDSEYPLHGR